MNLPVALMACFCLGTSNHRDCTNELDSLIATEINSFVATLDSNFNLVALRKAAIESIEATRKHLKRLGRVRSPFGHSEFYKYIYTHGTLNLVKYGFCGVDGLGVLYRNATSVPITPDSTVRQVNTLLQSEPRLDERGIGELRRFLMATSSLDEYWIVGDTSEGIDPDDIDTLSTLLNKYPRPTVRLLESGISTEFYCALQDRGALYYVAMKYDFKSQSIQVTSENLGEYGRKRRRIE